MENTKVHKVCFSLLTDIEIKKISVAEITREVQNDLTDVVNTPYDYRLGVTQPGKLCYTCMKDSIDCPGHFGHLTLVEPFFNPHYICIASQILKTICTFCSKPKIDKDYILLNGLSTFEKMEKFKMLLKESEKINVCINCNRNIPNFERINTDIYCFYSKKSKRRFTAKESYTVFEKITDDDFQFLGFNNDSSKFAIRPDSFIFSLLPISPPCSRPWVIMNGEICHDDITEKYNIIIKLNRKLLYGKKSKGKKYCVPLNEEERKKVKTELESHVLTLIDNHREDARISIGGRAHKSFTDRIKNKSGRIQNNISGKRSNESARTVITGGGLGIKTGELGVPQQIAQKLTKQVIVNNINREYLYTLLHEKKVTSIIKNGERRSLLFMKNPVLEIGDIVERQLLTGDYVLFNRQPTLRDASMMGMKIVVKKDNSKTFSFSLALTSPFNADFDGDEMNIFNSIDIKANVECQELMAAKNHIVSGQANKPIVGIIQEALISSFILTSSDIIVPWHIAFDCFFQIERTDIQEFFSRASEFWPECVEKTGKRLSESCPGKLFISIIFPSGFYFNKVTNTSVTCPEVIIENGILLKISGPLCSKVIGAKTNSIIHLLWKKSPTLCEEFITNIEHLNYRWFSTYGFSMGISDCMINDKREFIDTLSKLDIDCQSINSSNIDNLSKERKINEKLNSVMNSGLSIAKNNMNKGEKNSFKIMMTSGAKGSPINCFQVACCLGQQNVEGKRIPLMLSNKSRSLSHFQQNDNSPEARGFVYNSYLKGLNTSEMFFHSAGGREGLISTAIKTAEVGKNCLQQVGA
jgi:DNA-directed RNA polymerase beta' subunit